MITLKKKYMPKLHLRQPGFTHSAFVPFSVKRFKILKKQVI